MITISPWTGYSSTGNSTPLLLGQKYWKIYSKEQSSTGLMKKQAVTLQIKKVTESSTEE